MTPEPLRIGYLGPSGTFSHEALTDALTTLGSAAPQIEQTGHATISETVLAVESGADATALVPIENSIEGSVTETLDTLMHEAPSVRIAGETVHGVEHCLIAASSDFGIAEIELIESHPQPLAQCARWLRERAPNARLRQKASTAVAVEEAVREGGSRAAIGSRIAASEYGGTVLARSIADESGNETRFIWLARDDRRDEIAGLLGLGAANKTSVVFAGFNDTSAGALISILHEFADRGINMTKIESRPQRSSLGHYLFFADLEGAIDTPLVAEALDAVGRKVETLRVLGSFAAARH